MTCSPDLHFAVGAIVASCAILGTQGLILALGFKVVPRFFRYAAKEIRAAWDGRL